MDVANDIAAIFGLPTTKITHVRDRAFNDRRYYICDDKLAQLGARWLCCLCTSALRGRSQRLRAPAVPELLWEASASLLATHECL